MSESEESVTDFDNENEKTEKTSDKTSDKNSADLSAELSDDEDIAE